MIVYNITFKVDQEICEEWMQWQMNEHIPEIISTNLFSSFKFFQLLDQNDEDGPTYVIQYFADNKINYDHYIKFHAPALIEKSLKKWGNKFIAFKTLMKSVQ
jgi:hypothetical protein